MNEQRIQAYRNLIQQLLTCPNGEENQILNQSRELVEEEFVQVCEQVAQQLQEAGEENQARFLRSLAQELGEYLKQQPSGGGDESREILSHATAEDYLNFLMQVLQATQDSQGNPSVVYPMLQQNLDKLNFKLSHILHLASQTLNKLEKNNALILAANIGNFATLIQQFSWGSRVNNLEIAIIGYEISLTVFTREQAPENWATLQNNLGNAYRDRIQGEPGQNLERAIACYKEALQVYTRDAYPENWAMIQNNLGIAYGDRIQGEPGQNLELAIACYQEALQVYTRDAYPEDWAMIQNNLGIAYGDRIQGEPGQNLELAISCYQAALQVRTRDAFPENWATTQHNLGAAYGDRIEGERGQNLELAIASFQKALQVRTRDAFPEDWAGTQNNLGNAYSNRIQEERGQNLELAIASYQAALQVHTRDAFPEKWAMTQVNLADALVNCFECFAQDSHLHQAIAIYREVLDFSQQVSLTLDQAYILYKLGKALSRQGSYSQAIQSLEQVRALLEKPADLWLLALTFFELARLYHRIHRLEKARLYFKDTLRLFRRLGDQGSIADVMTELGNLQLQLGQIESARHHLEEAREYYQAKGNPERIEQIDWLLSLLREPREATARG